MVSAAEDMNLNLYLILHLRGHRRLMASIQDGMVMGKKNKMLLSTLYIAFSNTSYFTSVITNFSLPGKITQMLVYPRGW